VIKAGLRRRIQERGVNLRRDVEIAINRAVPKFDLEGAEPLAVADRRERL
jgi:hypothetical protein